ncbi:MAG: hypothetical protein ACOX88_08830 [Christensenellales bacterium]|jgi:hypothetical protein
MGRKDSSMSLVFKTSSINHSAIPPKMISKGIKFMSNKNNEKNHKISQIPAETNSDFTSVIAVLNKSLTPDEKSRLLLIDTEIERYVMKIIDCVDLAECGDLLIKYAAAAIKSNKCQVFIDQLYRRLGDYRPRAGHGKGYAVLDGADAKNTFLESLLPPWVSLEDSLKSMGSVGNQLTSYVQPIGKQLVRSKAEEILAYLNDKHLFTAKVYRDENVRIMLLKNSNDEYNSDSHIRAFNKFMLQDIVIFAMNLKHKDALPEIELFFQLAMGLYTRYSIMVPKRALHKIHDELHANYQQSGDYESQKIEQYANALKVGLMYDSPYESMLPLNKIGKRKAQRLKEAAEMTLSSL